MENQNMATAGNKKNFVGSDEEVELWLQVTLDYVCLLELPGQLEGPMHGNDPTCLFISLYWRMYVM